MAKLINFKPSTTIRGNLKTKQHQAVASIGFQFGGKEGPRMALKYTLPKLFTTDIDPLIA